MVTLTIDNKPVEVPEGTTVLRAAEKAGVFIPTLCDHPELTPYGGCRLCLVEVEGARTLQPSCTLPASNNMVVKTDTPRVLEARKFVLTLIFSERNHFCPYCPTSGGDCELQNSAYHEGMTHWPLQPNYHPFNTDASHPYFILDNNRCILCRRCVRACNELVGNFTLGIEERGSKSMLIADLGTPLGQSTCISCGMCVQLCPTGALIDRKSAYLGKETQVDHHESICTGCAVGCGIDVLTRDNHLVRIEGRWDAPVNGGVICKTGRFTPVDDKAERVKHPMLRKNDSLAPATWEEALGVVASKMEKLNGAAVAAAASSRLSAESLNFFKQIFAGHFGSDMTAALDDISAASLSARYAEELGQSFESTLDAADASDCAVIIGEDLVSDHEVAGFFIKRALPLGTHLVVVDAAENELGSLADITLKPSSAKYLASIQALTAAVVKLGLGKAPASISAADLDSLAAKASLPVDVLLRTAHMVAGSQSPVIFYGNHLSSEGDLAALKALREFATVTGAAMLCLTGKANSRVAAQYQLKDSFSPKGRQVAFIALGDEQPSQALIQQVKEASFVVVQASSVSALTAAADVVLPVANWAEDEGHYLSLDGHLQKTVRAITPAEEIKTNAEAFKSLAGRLGFDLKDDWKENLTQRVSAAPIQDL
jgi:formate dehydrogenase major subunit